MWTLIILFWCQSPKELARGLVEGTQSLFSNTVFAFSNAVTRISKAAHKVCHTLYFVLKFIYNSNNHRCGSSDLVSWSWYALVLFLFLETLSTCMLPSFPGWGTSFPSVGPHTWVYTLFLEWLWLCFTPTFNHNYDFILCTLNYSGLWRVDLITMIAPLIDAICGVEKQFMPSSGKLSKSNCLLQILSDALALNSLLVSYSNIKQNRTKDSKLQS